MYYIDENHLVFELNKNNYTAAISFSPNSFGNIIIPRSILYNSDEYVITSIKDGSFKNNEKIESIDFTEDSELKSIGKNAFAFSSLKKLTISQKVENLKNGWCKSSLYLNEILISPNNKNFIYLDESHKIILGKSDQNTENFDVLVFACRDINQAFIPSKIKRIDSYSFYECNDLCSINFSEDSELLSIGKGAFSYSSIEKVYIPQKVEILEDGWLGDTSNLNDICFSSLNQNFKYIDENHEIVVGKSNNSNNDFDVIIFASKKIEKVFIPSSIKKICSYAFSYCSCLKVVEFENNSQLKTIGKNAFSNTSIESISFPSSVEKIGKRTFSYCDSLKIIEFTENSELTSFENFLFYGSPIECISIQKKVVELKEDCLNNVSKLKKISISPQNKNFFFLDEKQKIIVGKLDSNNNVYDTIIFAYRDIEYVFIPHSIKQIKSSAFFECKSLKKIEFSEHSNLYSIGKCAFANSAIEEISIPECVNRISFMAFNGCNCLQKVEFSKSSKILQIEKNAFFYSAIKNIMIYSKLCTVGENAFALCFNLRTFEFLGDNITIDSRCFNRDENLFLVSFPNATKITICFDSFCAISKSLLFCLPFISLKIV